MWVQVTSFLYHKILKDLTIKKITLNIYRFLPHLQNK